LPDAVLFPRQVLPLHIFEPRYREMTAETLDGGQCIAVALLKPGFEQTYFTKHAPIHAAVGLGRIVAHERLEDGKYNILLRGEARAMVVEEISGRSYRVARLEPIASYCSAARAEVIGLRRSLRELIAAATWAPVELRERFVELCNAAVPLGEVSDVISGCLPIAGELRQALLAEADSYGRTLCLLEHLRTLGAVARTGRACVRQEQLNLN
jgi:Lon protease-like protein